MAVSSLTRPGTIAVDLAGCADARPRAAHRWRVLRRIAAVPLALALLGAVGVVTYQRELEALPFPAVAPVNVFAALFDTRPVTVSTTTLWQKGPLVMPRWEFLADHTVWLRMNFDDWDRLPGDVREAGLARLLARYGALVAARRAWPSMTAADWDLVPQPIRAMAFAGMIDHWTRVYAPGAAYGLEAREVAQTLKAIAMSESWFDHRAWNVNRDGSVDLGLAGASARARELTREWHDEGAIALSLRDRDYFNPWKATEWLVFWFGLTLDDAGGNLDLAIRAYNCGVYQARHGCGDGYLQAVLRRRAQYFEGPSGSPTWRALSDFRHAYAGVLPTTARPAVSRLPW